MNRTEPIAVVAMAGVFPGAPDLDAFWHNLVNRIDAAAPVPADRWIAGPELMVDASGPPDKAYGDRACLIRDFSFDPAGFHLDAALLAGLDPMHQLALAAARTAYSACQTQVLDPQRIAVMLAAIALPSDAASRLTRVLMAAGGEKAEPLPPSLALGARVTGLPAALIARALGLGGGSLTLDAACASSLYAVKLACNALQSGRADAVVTGGVSRPDALFTQVGFTQLRALSPTGRCAPFDAGADGLVVGEGAGILILKRLDDARKAGDRIFGVIRGLGLSNDMRGNLLAPDTEGQLRAMRAAYAQAGWSPAEVDLIECHGAGTPVGDATELKSLCALWQDLSVEPGTCPIGSVKSAIGHLLTAAGAAGIIKTLLAMDRSVLPPSLNFTGPGPDSPLVNSPFRVQTDPEPWPVRDPDRGKRAAVSAFGFGGINAHLLIEKWRDEDAKSPGGNNLPPVPHSRQPEKSAMEAMAPHRFPEKQTVAVVGMGARFGPFEDLAAFGEGFFSASTGFGPAPEHRWRGAQDRLAEVLGRKPPWGAYLASLGIHPGQFRIPPKEIPDILFQHLLMLCVAAEAMEDAGLPLRESRPDTGVVVGMEFDMEACDYHLRWHLAGQAGTWAREDKSLSRLQDACSPPLTASRTLGALGGIIASRIAREFGFGGPSFTVSNDAASGLRALETGMRLLEEGQTATMLVCAVDLPGDLRRLVQSGVRTPFSSGQRVLSLDAVADGTLPGEGAVALVLKPLARAMAEKDRVYAVIRGVGAASGVGIDTAGPDGKTWSRSLNQALEEADTAPERIGLMTLQGSAAPTEDRRELTALGRVFADPDSDWKPQCALASVTPVIGNTGAASGLAATVAACLALHHRTLPPLAGFRSGDEGTVAMHPALHVPRKAQYWMHDRSAGPRMAGVSATSPDGSCMHLVLEEAETRTPVHAGIRSAALPGTKPEKAGLFAVTGPDATSLVGNLDRLVELAKTADGGIPPAALARIWFGRNRPDSRHHLALALVCDRRESLVGQLAAARRVLTGDVRIEPGSRIHFTPAPLGPGAEVALVFPGSGNARTGMGCDLMDRWPSVLDAMDRTTGQLKTLFHPALIHPWRRSWKPGWPAEADTLLAQAPLASFMAQTAYGIFVSDLLRSLGLHPRAAVGYSLGETSALFALEAWTDRDAMIRRMLESDLMTTGLVGPCKAVRAAWNLPRDRPVDWCAATVNHPAAEVIRALNDRPFVRLMITNTPTQCVIGGCRPSVGAFIAEIASPAVFLSPVAAVHCDAAATASRAYGDLHRLPVTLPPGIRIYSCALGRPHEPDPDKVADALAAQAAAPFDFDALIRRVYADGARIFVETGPRSSCTAMIAEILADRPHLPLSVDNGQEDGFAGLLDLLAELVAHRVGIDLAPIYGQVDDRPSGKETHKPQDRIIVRETGGSALPRISKKTAPPTDASSDPSSPAPGPPPSSPSLQTDAGTAPPEPGRHPLANLAAGFDDAAKATADAHERFLDLSRDMTDGIADAFDLQTRLMTRLAKVPPPPPGEDQGKTGGDPFPMEKDRPPRPVFHRSMCMEFAVGSVAKMLGPQFAVVDTFRTRVRLPDEPLMLVDRIMALEGAPLSLGSGRVVTEHDVLPGAWYLDGDRAPVCISVEAGQADLFLCAYLGIDHQVRGERSYRLLDARVTFHRDLPRPGETIRYDIRIDKFVRQGRTWLFFFSFEGTIDGRPLITMTDGCAGFFTPEEVENSGGILLTPEETAPAQGFCPPGWQPPVPMEETALDAKALDALRAGDAGGCFGPAFAGLILPAAQRLPGGRMHLIDRVVELDPVGGRYGLGSVRAEADIRPDDWFLACHFMDDMVMPGTLMYECCAHTLRVFFQRMGWVSDHPAAGFEPVCGVGAVLKCRGPVTPETKMVVYEVEIKEIGYGPEPFVRADALMAADGRAIVLFRDMSLRLTHAGREGIEAFWRQRSMAQETGSAPSRKVLYDAERILAFSVGNPSEAFGEPYRIFDRERRIARLPGPPYLFMDRIVAVEPEPWVLQPGGWIEAEYDVPADAWYFRADRSGHMPFCVLLEIALQPCGWLAAYLGSALRSDKDLKFRNLGGSARVFERVGPDAGTLTMRARLTRVSEAGDMIIEDFDFQVLRQGRVVYEGTTNFGFFTPEALANQKGIRGAEKRIYQTAGEENGPTPVELAQVPPMDPDDPSEAAHSPLALPARALTMIDAVTCSQPDGGPHGLGYVRGIKRVDPGEWFFKAHFFQDPVCPGSLGIESMIQLVKFAALERWPHLRETHRFEPVLDRPHVWVYRGQVIPANREVTVSAVVTQVEEADAPLLLADGWLAVDGLLIYEMKGFGVRLVAVKHDL